MNEWSLEEIKIIKDNYLNMTDEEISEKLLPNRTKKSIEKQRLKYGFKKQKANKIWSKDEIDTIIKLYPLYTDEELMDFLPNRTKRAIEQKGLELGLKKNEDVLYEINVKKTENARRKIKECGFSEEHKRNISNTRKEMFRKGMLVSPWKGRKVTEEEKERSRMRVKGRWGGNKNPRHIKPLYRESNGNWKGGLTELSQFIRENLTEWKSLSMESCSYKCIFTGLNFNEIHHINPLNKMIKIAIEELDLKEKEDYNKLERDRILYLVKEKHNNIGICMCREIHKLFHDIYSRLDFDMNDLIEFSKDYFNGKYDNLLSEEKRSYNSKSNIHYVLELIKIIY